MTCIVALKAEDRVYMGADTCVLIGGVETRKEKYKLFRIAEFLFGCCGDVAVHQAIEKNLEIYRDDYINENIHNFLITKIRLKIKNILEEYGCLKVINGVVSMDSDILIGFKNRFFVMYSDFSIIELDEIFNSIGAASSYALGAMEALLHSKECLGYSYEEIILKVLEISQKYSNAVKAPFEILHT